jgi:ribonuclease D
VALATRAPQDHAELERVEDLPRALLRRHGEALLRMSRDADARRPPERAVSARLEPAQERQARKLMGRLREIAQHQRVSAPLLATRRDIEALVQGQRELPLLQGWRRELAGEELLRMLTAT